MLGMVTCDDFTCFPRCVELVYSGFHTNKRFPKLNLKKIKKSPVSQGVWSWSIRVQLPPLAIQFELSPHAAC